MTGRLSRRAREVNHTGAVPENRRFARGAEARAGFDPVLRLSIRSSHFMPPTPDPRRVKLKAAADAMFADYQAIAGKLATKSDPTERDEYQVELMREFCAAHADTIEAMAEVSSHPVFAAMRAQLQMFTKIDDEIERADDEDLDAQAKIGEAAEKEAVAGLELLEALEADFAENGAAKDPEMRRHAVLALEHCRKDAPRLLRQLPIEQRREWEKRLGI